MHRILTQDAEILKIAKLVDSDKLIYLEPVTIRLSIQTTMYSQLLSEQKYKKILEWLSVSPYYNYHRFVSQSRLPGLGKWLLNNKDYVDWQTSSSSSMLLLHGIIGSGKSMLCSLVVDSLVSITEKYPLTAPFGYIYCTNTDFERAPRSSDDVMRSILSQLAYNTSDQHKIKDFLCSEYERQVARAKVNGLDLPKLRMQDCVRLILELAEQDSLIIIIDAIDTVREDEQHALISALKRIIVEADNVVKILITSRSSNCTSMVLVADKQIQIISRETQQDMESFVNHQINTAVASKLLLKGDVSLALRSMIIRSLLEEAGER
jgi:hypothetical protein